MPGLRKASSQVDFPKRTRQQKSEAHSYAVLLYKLRNLGIFRNLTENDYGIDFELELVVNDEVRGQLVKLQVKAAENLKLRADQTPTISGIKQSTLAYWCELSFRNNVIAYAVDLATETVYVSENLFWQATKLIDGGDKTKTIEFLAAGEDGQQTAELATIIQGIAPTAADQVFAHTLALRRLGDFLTLLIDADHYDAGSELHQPDHFRELLETARYLLWWRSDKLWSDPKDRKHWTRYDYWAEKSEADGWGELSYHTVKPVLGVLVPAMVRELRNYRKGVLDGRYYWANRKPEYLELVFRTEIPDVDDVAALIAWQAEREHGHHGGGGAASYFVQEAKKPVKKGRPEIKKMKKNVKKRAKRTQLR